MKNKVKVQAFDRLVVDPLTARVRSVAKREVLVFIALALCQFDDVSLSFKPGHEISNRAWELRCRQQKMMSKCVFEGLGLASKDS